MDSDIHHRNHNQQQQHQQQQQPAQNMYSGLTRYRSAPSSYFTNLIDSGIYGDEDLDPLFNPRIPSPETERILSRFMSGDDGSIGNLSSQKNLDQIRGNEFMKQEQVNFSTQIQEQQQMMYQNHVQSQEIVHNNNSIISSSSSDMVDRLSAMGPPTNLLRQSSSPAGFSEHSNIENGYTMMRSMDKFHPANGNVPDSSFSSTNRLQSSKAFSSASLSSSRLLSRIPEHEGRTMTHNNGGYVASFHGGSWDDGFPNEFVESGQTSSSENQENLNDERRIQSIHTPTGLTHQLSLPTSATESSVKEKLLQFQDSVPLRSRAKRGCATHPRSIAERVRRTRISERMRKLQDLVPNMDKQTSTADMLDLAVDYIKGLQNEVETLSDRRKKCICQRKLKS